MAQKFHSRVCQKTHTRMFIASLFIIIQNWSQPKYPPRRDLNKLMVLYYAAANCTDIRMQTDIAKAIGVTLANNDE